MNTCSIILTILILETLLVTIAWQSSSDISWIRLSPFLKTKLVRKPLTLRHNGTEKLQQCTISVDRERRDVRRWVPESTTTLSRPDVPHLQSLVIRTTHDLLIVDLQQSLLQHARLHMRVSEQFLNGTSALIRLLSCLAMVW